MMLKSHTHLKDRWQMDLENNFSVSLKNLKRIQAERAIEEGELSCFVFFFPHGFTFRY